MLCIYIYIYTSSTCHIRHILSLLSKVIDGSGHLANVISFAKKLLYDPRYREVPVVLVSMHVWAQHVLRGAVNGSHTGSAEAQSYSFDELDALIDLEIKSSQAAAEGDLARYRSQIFHIIMSVDKVALSPSLCCVSISI